MPRSTALLVYPHTTQLLVATPTLELANNDPGAYGMQINALQRQVHLRVALANDEADHKLEASLNRFINKDPIQVGDRFYFIGHNQPLPNHQTYPE